MTKYQSWDSVLARLKIAKTEFVLPRLIYGIKWLYWIDRAEFLEETPKASTQNVAGTWLSAAIAVIRKLHVKERVSDSPSWSPAAFLIHLSSKISPQSRACNRWNRSHIQNPSCKGLWDMSYFRFPASAIEGIKKSDDSLRCSVSECYQNLINKPLFFIKRVCAYVSVRNVLILSGNMLLYKVLKVII